MLAEQIKSSIPVSPLPQIPGKNILVVGHAGNENESLVADLLKGGANVIWAVQGAHSKSMHAIAGACGYQHAWRNRLHMPMFNVQKHAEVGDLVQYCHDHVHNLDAVVVNFGDHDSGPRLTETSVEDVSHTVNGRLYANILLARAFTPILAKREQAAYIFISGHNSQTPLLAGCLRSAESAAELALAKGLAFEMGARPHVYSLLMASHHAAGSQCLDSSCIGEAVGLIVKDPAYAKNQVVIQGEWREVLDPSAQPPEYSSCL